MTPAVNELKQKRAAYRLHSYQHDPATASYGLEAAEKMGVNPAQVFKTLLVQADTGSVLVAILPVEKQLSLKNIAQLAGVKKVQMADAAQAQRMTGYVLGGISPLGQKKRLPTFIDAQALMFEQIFFSAGRRGLEIELAPQLLADLTSAVWGDLTA